MNPIKVGVLVSSDRASQGAYTDRSGPAVQRYVDAHLAHPIDWVVAVIPDDYDAICQRLVEMTDKENCDLVITSGGTGPAPRDVIPDATEAVCEKMLPGFGEQMRRISLQYVPTAILSRQTAGIRHSTLILNLPGKPKAVRECLDAVFPALPDCIDLIGGPRLELAQQPAYRPHNDASDEAT